MIQSPNSDGPPNLDAFFDPARRSVGTVGAPITLATARVLLSNHSGDPAAAVDAALATASQSLSAKPQLVHVTLSPDVDASIVADRIAEALPSAALIGRTVTKKDSAGTLELLLLRSAAGCGITFGSASVPLGTGPDSAVESAASAAATAALESLDEACTFLVFGHCPGGSEDAARKGLAAAFPGGVAYGGPAVGEGCVLFGGAPGSGSRATREGDGEERVMVAAVPGSLAFLTSAIVKNWAQPVYTAPMPYMTPRYVGDAAMDLLTAIRYDDWEKFTWCIEEEGVGVNTRWIEKQNQIPLLAACARVRTRMIKYLLERGADVEHRNDGGFTAAMYTRMLTEYDTEVVRDQLRMLEEAGATTKLTEDEVEKLKTATNGRIVE